MVNPSDFAQDLAAGVEPDSRQTIQSNLIAIPANGVVLKFIAPRASKFVALRVNAGNYGTAAGPSVFTATKNGVAFGAAVALSVPNTATDDSTQTISGGDQAIAEGDTVEITLSGAATGLADLVCSVDFDKA